MEDIVSRIKIAVEFLQKGLPFKVGALSLSICKDGMLNVLMESQHVDIKNVTKQGAIHEIGEIKFIFNKMVVASNELQEFIKGLEIIFSLSYNYGMGSFGLCSELSNNLIWEYEIK